MVYQVRRSADKEIPVGVVRENLHKMGYKTKLIEDRFGVPNLLHVLNKEEKVVMTVMVTSRRFVKEKHLKAVVSLFFATKVRKAA